MNDKAANMVEHLKERKADVENNTSKWWNKLNLKDSFQNNKPQYLWGAVGAVSLIGAGVAYQLLRKK